MVSPPDTDYLGTIPIFTYTHTQMPIPTNLRRYIHYAQPTRQGGGGEEEVPCMIIGFQKGSTANPRNHSHRIYTYIHIYIHTCVHTYILTYIHTYTPVSTNLRKYIHTTPNPPHRGACGEAEVPCTIERFQGGSTPNPRNHPHRLRTYIYTYVCTYIHINFYILWVDHKGRELKAPQVVFPRPHLLQQTPRLGL